MTVPRAYHQIKKLSREELKLFVAENIKTLGEDEANAVIENAFVTPAMLMAIAQSPRLAGYYSVRVRRAPADAAGAVDEARPLPLLVRPRAVVARSDGAGAGTPRHRHATSA
jgi:hypothetical protein